MREESQYQALLDAYTGRGYELLEVERERDAARRSASAWKRSARGFRCWFRETADMHDERMRERDALQSEVERLRRGIEAYRSRIAANTDEDLAVACREYLAWEREDGKRYER